MTKNLTIGESLTGDMLEVSLKYHTIIAGQTGSGKTVLLKNLIKNACETYGSFVRFIIFDPKKVGFLDLKSTCTVITRQIDFVEALKQLETQMERRYALMEDNEVDSFNVSPDNPYLVIVIDELISFMSNPFLRKEEKQFLTVHLSYLIQQCRQAGITFILSSQSFDAKVIDTSVRTAFAQRIILGQQNMDQLKIAVEGRLEEVLSVVTFSRPGQFMLCSPLTSMRYVEGFAPQDCGSAAALKAGRRGKLLLPQPR